MIKPSPTRAETHSNAMESYWNNAPWGDARFISPDGNPIRSDYPPQIIGFGSNLYCFWAQTNKLQYCILERSEINDTWTTIEGSQPSMEIPATGLTTEIATSPPALAFLYGNIHVVFPDEKKRLIHIRLDPTTGAWGNRYAVGVETSSQPVMAVFKNRLFCVYTSTEEQNPGRAFLVTWDQMSGWQKASASPCTDLDAITSSPLALFELHGRLHLYLVQHQGNSDVACHYICNGNPGSIFETRDLNGSPQVATGSGFSGCTVNSIGFLAYLDAGQGIVKGQSTITIAGLPSLDLTMKQNFEAVVKGYPTESNPRVPQLAIVGNTVMCIWVDGLSNHIMYRTRRVWMLPALSGWMAGLENNLFISQVSIPGTHDSASIEAGLSAHFMVDQEMPMVITQSMSITQQLRSGVRYLDIRAGFDKPTEEVALLRSESKKPEDFLIAYHGRFAIRRVQDLIATPEFVTISSIMEECYDFLAQHESECILMQIKQDWPVSPSADDVSLFAEAMMALINSASEVVNAKRQPRWRLEGTFPTIGDLRGRIQLVRRFAGVEKGDQNGLDVWTDWPNNDSSPMNSNDAFSLVVQDEWQWAYSSSVCENKYKLVLKYLKLARQQSNPRVWYINFASATALWWPAGAASVSQGWEGVMGVNKRLSGFFNDEAPKLIGKGTYGTILLDYAEVPKGLILAIIRTNFPKAAAAKPVGAKL